MTTDSGGQAAARGRPRAVGGSCPGAPRSARRRRATRWGSVRSRTSPASRRAPCTGCCRPCSSAGTSAATGPASTPSAPRAIRLADAAQRALARSARPHLAELVRLSGETANLAVLEGDDVVYVAQISSPHTLRMFAEVGRHVPPHSTAVGKVLLAALPREHALAVLRRTGLAAAHPGHHHRPRHAFAAELDRVAAQGWAADEEEQEIGVRCVAVPGHRGPRPGRRRPLPLRPRRPLRRRPRPRHGRADAPRRPRLRSRLTGHCGHSAADRALVGTLRGLTGHLWALSERRPGTRRHSHRTRSASDRPVEPCWMPASARSARAQCLTTARSAGGGDVAGDLAEGDPAAERCRGRCSAG